MAAIKLQINHLYKQFENLVLFEDFNMELKRNSITCILGPSGCGKTTLLNILCGVENTDRGDVSNFNRQSFSYIFQESTLLKWKTVLENITFVLPSYYTSQEKKKLSIEYIKMVSLEGYENYYPHQLSGGMKQRVSIARSFAYPSDIILMDEPFKALDIKLKNNIISTFKKLWVSDQRTVIFVSHDVEEALQMGSEIYVLSDKPVSVKKHFVNTLKSEELDRHHPNFIQLEKAILNNLE